MNNPVAKLVKGRRIFLWRHDDEESRSMCAKFSILPQRNETNAQEFERDTLAKYSERAVLIGHQLVVRRHGGGGAPSGGAHGSAPVGIPRTGIVTTPLTQPPTG